MSRRFPILVATNLDLCFLSLSSVLCSRSLLGQVPYARSSLNLLEIASGTPSFLPPHMSTRRPAVSPLPSRYASVSPSATRPAKSLPMTPATSTSTSSSDRTPRAIPSRTDIAPAAVQSIAGPNYAGRGIWQNQNQNPGYAASIRSLESNATAVRLHPRLPGYLNSSVV